MATDTDTPKIPEMVERVAAAMYATAFPDGIWLEANWTQRAVFRAYAQSAIVAIREPTASMAAAGERESLRDGAHDCEVPEASIWRSMIDAALKE